MTEYNSIPKALADTPQWLCYKLVDTGKARKGKPPYSPLTGIKCAKNDESQFTTLQQALLGMERYDLDGVGFVFASGFVAIDLDDCFQDNGTLTPVAQNIFDHFTDTFWEYSPSGNGLHGFMYGEKPNERTKDSALGIEVYSGYNFVTVTGDHVEGTALDATNQQDALDWLYAEYLPPLVSHDYEPSPVNHGDKTAEEWLRLGLEKDAAFAQSYNDTQHEGRDESSVDMSLLMRLSYWLNRDPDAMRQAFVDSPWAQTKKPEHIKKMMRDDYLPNTIEKKVIPQQQNTAFLTSQTYQAKAIRFFSNIPISGENLTLEDYTDLGNAIAMSEIFADVLCYTKEWGWCFYNGSRWEIDVDHRAFEAAKDVAQGLMINAKEWLDRVNADVDALGMARNGADAKEKLAPAKAFMAHAMKSQSEHGLTAMVNLNKRYMQTSANLFDTDGWVLNTPQGVVDLKTGEMMPHDAKYRLTRMTNISPADVDTPTFDTFMQRAFCKDKELIDYTQLIIGASLVGKVYNENLIIANGSGANGKSTLLNALLYLIGDYGTSIDPDLLMSDKPAERQVGMAMLQGTRLAVAQETEEGQRLRSAMLKRLTSTDEMVAKKLYHNPHHFIPTHTLILSTNHLPKVSSIDMGTWRRLVVLPFEATIKADEMIADLHSILIEREGDGILKWAIDGAVKFFALNCNISDVKPKAVLRASDEYRSNEDWITNFLGECCTDGDPNNEDIFIRHNDIYRVYHSWAKNAGEFVRTSNAFGKALQSAGWRGKQKYFDPKTKTTTKIWYGYDLLDGGRVFSLVDNKQTRIAR